MHNTLDNREARGPQQPTIGGSVAAFYVVVIVLVLVVVAASTAVIYLLLEERANRKLAGHHAHRDDPLKGPNKAPKPWYRRIFGRATRDFQGNNHDTRHNSREQGWIQARSADEWDSDSGDESKAPKPTGFLPLRQKEYNPSLNTKRSSTAYSLPQSPVHSLSFDRSSVLPSDVSNFSHNDVYTPSNRHSIPSIQSQLLAPLTIPNFEPNLTISEVPSSPVNISTSPVISGSPVSIEHMPSDLPFGSNSADIAHPGFSFRTFGSGTKFIEAL